MKGERPVSVWPFTSVPMLLIETMRLSEVWQERIVGSEEVQVRRAVVARTSTVAKSAGDDVGSVCGYYAHGTH